MHFHMGMCAHACASQTCCTTVLKHMSLPLQAKATVAVADADLYTQEQQECLHINIHILALDRGPLHRHGR